MIETLEKKLKHQENKTVVKQHLKMTHLSKTKSIKNEFAKSY